MKPRLLAIAQLHADKRTDGRTDGQTWRSSHRETYL